jgi:hypothetical protein
MKPSVQLRIETAQAIAAAIVANPTTGNPPEQIAAAAWRASTAFWNAAPDDVKAMVLQADEDWRQDGATLERISQRSGPQS